MAEIMSEQERLGSVLFENIEYKYKVRVQSVLVDFCKSTSTEYNENFNLSTLVCTKSTRFRTESSTKKYEKVHFFQINFDKITCPQYASSDNSFRAFRTNSELRNPSRDHPILFTTI